MRFTVVVAALLSIAACAKPASSTPASAPHATPLQASHAAPLQVSVARPTFTTTEGPFSAGTAFVLKIEKQLLLVTAQHLFGEAGGLSRQYTWNELPGLVQGVVAKSPDGRNELESTTVLPIPGAVALSDDDEQHDVSAFLLTASGNFTALEPAASEPQAGDEVFLLAPVYGSTATRHRAVVFEGPATLCYLFDDDIELRATSGAPVVDKEGRVVGINLGGGTLRDKPFGFANPTKSFAKLIVRALGEQAGMAPSK